MDSARPSTSQQYRCSPTYPTKKPLTPRKLHSRTLKITLVVSIVQFILSGLLTVISVVTGFDHQGIVGLIIVFFNVAHAAFCLWLYFDEHVRVVFPTILTIVDLVVLFILGVIVRVAIGESSTPPWMDDNNMTHYKIKLALEMIRDSCGYAMFVGAVIEIVVLGIMWKTWKTYYREERKRLKLLIGLEELDESRRVRPVYRPSVSNPT